MIPQTKIDQAAGDYRDGLLKEKNRTTGQFVGIPPTHKEIEAMVIGYADGMTAGVRFAESKMGISEEDRIHLKNTLALMNSMIKCGENHSKVSEEMLTKAFLILKPTHENES